MSAMSPLKISVGHDCVTHIVAIFNDPMEATIDSASGFLYAASTMQLVHRIARTS